MDQQLKDQDRYCTLQERGRALLDRMHPGLACRTDLDGVQNLLDALERVLLHGDRARLGHAQAARSVESPPPPPAAGAEAAGEAQAAGGGGPSLSCAPAGEIPPAIDPEMARAWAQTDPFNQMLEEGGAAAGKEATAGDAPAEGGAGGAALPPVILSQRPPVSKPGRTRGWAPGKAAARPPKPQPKRRAKAKAAPKPKPEHGA